MMTDLNYPAIASFVLFIIATLFITAYAARRTRSRKDFYVAGNTIGGIQNGIAISGDYMSAASFLGLVGLFYLAGYDTIFFIVNLILSWAVVLFLIAEKLRNLGSYTFADAVSVRLQARPIRLMAAVVTLAVAVPYLLAQMVAAGTLFESLFGLSYTQGVLVVGVLMTIYVTFGGMIATTWVQIIKAVLLVGGGTILSVGVLAAFDFNIGKLAGLAVDAHPRGIAIMQPGLLYPDIVSVVSLTLAFVGGTAGLPHVLMRFFTVPDGVQARRSAAWAMGIISYFQFVVVFIGLGAIVLLTGNPEFTSGGLALPRRQQHGGGPPLADHRRQHLHGFYLRGRVRHHSCRGFGPDVIGRRDRFPRPVCRRHPQGGLHRRGRTARVQGDRGPVERRRHVAGNPVQGPERGGTGHLAAGDRGQRQLPRPVPVHVLERVHHPGRPGWGVYRAAACRQPDHPGADRLGESAGSCETTVSLRLPDTILHGRLFPVRLDILSYG